MIDIERSPSAEKKRLNLKPPTGFKFMDHYQIDVGKPEGDDLKSSKIIVED